MGHSSRRGKGTQHWASTHLQKAHSMLWHPKEKIGYGCPAAWHVCRSQGTFSGNDWKGIVLCNSLHNCWRPLSALLHMKDFHYIQVVTTRSIDELRFPFLRDSKQLFFKRWQLEKQTSIMQSVLRLIFDLLLSVLEPQTFCTTYLQK